VGSMIVASRKSPLGLKGATAAFLFHPVGSCHGRGGFLQG
jgi:hypothetical protein